VDDVLHEEKEKAEGGDLDENCKQSCANEVQGGEHKGGAEQDQ
jgi:hypothetical protein